MTTINTTMKPKTAAGPITIANAMTLEPEVADSVGTTIVELEIIMEPSEV